MKKIILSGLVMAAALTATATPQAEYLNRGVVAVKTDNGVFVSWRSLTSDAKGTTFDVYRDGVKVNEAPITKSTNFVDAQGSETSSYVIKAVLNDQVVEEAQAPEVWGSFLKKIHLDRPAGGTTPDGVEYTYSPNDCSVGDVDGDGQYELFVKWDPSNSQDNSYKKYSGNAYIDCYTLEGKKLWRIDLGKNIRAGAHYTQFMVYDFDGDGKAEMACKTAPGTVDGLGNYVIMGDDDPTADYRNSSGIIISGPEYLTIFNGQTGAEINTVSYVPLRSAHAQSSSGWGDNYGNRSERYLACVAYLDGEKPSLVMCRGYYTHAYLCAWDFDGKELKQRWLHASTTKGKGAYGEGAHGIAVGDVDGDGCDEIVYGSACIDHDGTVLYRTGAGHGDALHLGDLDPDREGLEVFMVHEEKTSSYKWDAEFRDAATGEIIWGLPQSGNDIGRGVSADIYAGTRGCEAWPSNDYSSGSQANSTYDCKGNKIFSKRPSCNFRIYWDDDLQDELLDGSKITKQNQTLSSNTLVDFNKYNNAQSCNSTKATPNLSADILGDWREEVILWDGDTSSDLLLFTTTTETSYKVPCLMQDHVYRMGIAWQNVAYNQPPHLGYYLPDLFNTAASFKSLSGQMNQTIYIGESIEPITYQYNNATGVTVNGLPSGVTMTVDDKNMTFTIEGQPAEVGTYEYTVKSVGGETEATLVGTIIVREKPVISKIAYFPFDVVGTTTPNMVYGEATVITGTPESTEGVTNGALQLDGKTYLTQESYDGFKLGKSDFTIEFWFKSTDDAAYILHKGTLSANSTTGAEGKWVGVEYKSGNLRFAVDDNVTKSEVSAGAAEYFNGEWTHVACVRDTYSGTINLYINGALAASANDKTGDCTDYNDLLVIGNVNVSFDNTFTGALDELTFYNAALSATDIKDHYENPATSGIADIVVNKNAEYSIVSATTGVILGRSKGSIEKLTSNLTPGCYILVTNYGTSSEARKIVIR